MFVYLITNKVNGKRYVGQHVGNCVNTYWKRKIYLAQEHYKYTRNQALSSAIRKYGPDKFEIKILVIVGSKEELDYYEIGLIKSLKSKVPFGYNLTDGGGGSLGRSPSPECRARIAAGLLGIHKPNKLKGVPRTEETCKRISQGLAGKKLSVKHIEALRVGSHNRYHTNRNVVNPKCPLCRQRQQ